MLTLSRSRLGTGVVTLAVWALAAGSVVYWGLRLSAAGSSAQLPPSVVSPPAVAVDARQLARALGAEAGPAVGTQAPAASRFALLGVVAGTADGGSALIAVDGQPARPYRVGGSVDAGLLLQSVRPRQATLAQTRDGPAAFTLDMPALSK